MRSYLIVEDYPKNLPRISPGSYSKAKFAKLMSCSEKLLDNLEILTSSIIVDKKLNNSPLVGNTACRYCVQKFRDGKIWVGENIPIDNPLRTCCDVELAKNQIQSIIDEVLKNYKEMLRNFSSLKS